MEQAAMRLEPVAGATAPADAAAGAGLSAARFRRADLDGLAVAATEKVAAMAADPGFADKVAASEIGWTLRWDGRVIAVGGIAEIWPGRGVCWALPGPAPLRAWPQITRFVAAVLDRAQRRGFHRLECTVDAGHPAGMRWARRLGFEVEGVARQITPDRRDHLVYARIKE